MSKVDDLLLPEFNFDEVEKRVQKNMDDATAEAAAVEVDNDCGDGCKI
jgi:hypothetical protein